MNRSENHSKLVHTTLLELSKLQNVRVWKSHTGQAYTKESVWNAFKVLIEKFKLTRDVTQSIKSAMQVLRPIAYGKIGQADITGIVGPSGQSLNIEIKTGQAIQNKDQKNFQKMVNSLGGIYEVIHNEHELQKLKDFLK